MNYFLLTQGKDYFRLEEILQSQRNFNLDLIFSFFKLYYEDVYPGDGVKHGIDDDDDVIQMISLM